MIQKLNVAHVYSDSAGEWNCSEFRCLSVANAINYVTEHNTDHVGYKAKLIHISGFLDYQSPAIQFLLKDVDLIIVQRNVITPGVLEVIRYWQGLGKAVAIDLDDDYPGLPPANPAYAFWIENSAKLDPPPLQVLEEGIRITNALISPSRQILRDWAHVGRGYFVNNFFRDEWWTELQDRESMKAKLGLTGRVVIGWGGSVSHYDSWWGSGLREAARAIVYAYPDVVFMICGNDPRLYDQLDVPLRNKFAQPGVDPSQWPQIVKTFDIGVAPLSGTFDQRRSWIKTAEYGLAGVPWVAQAGEPYREHAGLGQLIPPNPIAWERALRETLDNLPTLQAEATERVDFYQQWLIRNQVNTIIKQYRAIINNAQLAQGQLPEIHIIEAGPEVVNENEQSIEMASVPEVGEVVANNALTDEDVVDPALLADIGARNLAFLESCQVTTELYGVNLVQANSYDLVRILNEMYLS